MPRKTKTKAITIIPEQTNEPAVEQPTIPKADAVVAPSDVKPNVVPSSDKPKERKNNKWIEHVREYRVANPTVSYKEALKLAKANYKK